MTSLESTLTRLHQDLGWKRLPRGWAKVEIFLGLTVAGIGLGALLGAIPPLVGSPPQWLHAARGLVLFVLGVYLAMAGHRSHLYQSNVQLAAYVLATLQPRQAPNDRSWAQEVGSIANAQGGH